MESGSVVTIYLIEPVERFWGRLLHLTPAGATLRGIPVDQIESFKYQLKKKNPNIRARTVFYPMRRVQTMDLDEPIGDLPSVIDSIKTITGLEEETIFR